MKQLSKYGFSFFLAGRSFFWKALLQGQWRALTGMATLKQVNPKELME